MKTMFDPLATRIDLALAAMNARPPSDTPELDALFARLRTASGRERTETTQRIWANWHSHEEAAARETMQAVIAAFDFGDLDRMGEALDAMVERWPDWAEAWNKRATLHFVEDRHAESLDDIARTLEREPRHFGALGGFGQICLGAGELTPALLVFERLLAIDPGVEEVRHAVAMLRTKTQHTIH